MAVPEPSKISSSSGRALASATPAAKVVLAGSPARPPPQRRVPTVTTPAVRASSRWSLAAWRPLAGQGEERLGGEVERGRVDELRLGRPAPAHGHEDGRAARRHQVPGQLGGDGGLARPLAGADDGDRRLRGQPGPGRHLEGEARPPVGHAPGQGVGGEEASGCGRRGRAGRTGRRPRRGRSRSRPASRAASGDSPATQLVDAVVLRGPDGGRRRDLLRPADEGGADHGPPGGAQLLDGRPHDRRIVLAVDQHERARRPFRLWERRRAWLETSHAGRSGGFEREVPMVAAAAPPPNWRSLGPPYRPSGTPVRRQGTAGARRRNLAIRSWAGHRRAVGHAPLGVDAAGAGVGGVVDQVRDGVGGVGPQGAGRGVVGHAASAARGRGRRGPRPAGR